MIEAYFLLTDQSVVKGWVPEGRDMIRMGPNLVPFFYDFSVKENGHDVPVYKESMDHPTTL